MDQTDTHPPQGPPTTTERWRENVAERERRRAAKAAVRTDQKPRRDWGLAQRQQQKLARNRSAAEPSKQDREDP